MIIKVFINSAKMIFLKHKLENQIMVVGQSPVSLSLTWMTRAQLPLWNRVPSTGFTHYFSDFVKNIELLQHL